MEYYYVNDNATYNPGYNHEVHTEKHAKDLGIVSKTYLGYFSGCNDALIKAKIIYSNADGCASCCPLCHRG